MAEGGILNGVQPLSAPFSLLLIQILVILLTCRALAILLRYVRQPAVIAEVVGGIVLGPSVFGLIPGYMDTLFPKESLPLLSVIAQLGLVFYLFLVGLELDLELVKARIGQSFAISLAGMIVPFLISIGTSYFLWITYLQEMVTFPTLMLFLGVAMSITAFPVLARILGELHLFSTAVGIQAISAAAIDDAAAWALLALVIGIISASTPLNALYIVLLAIGFALIMLLGVRRLLSWLFYRGMNADGSISQWIIFVVFMIILAAALTTEIIGIHAIFGGFLAGLAIPRGRGFELMLTEKLEDFVTVLFLPLFFAASGLKTNIGLLDDATAWGAVFLVILTACTGKIIGCTVAARAIKMSWRESFAVGILMNTKGLVELVVLNIGLDGNVIDAQVFTIMVLMAIVTTIMTTPLITFVYPPKYYRRADGEEDVDDVNTKDEPDLARAVAKHFRPLVCLPGLRFVPTMMNLVKMMKMPVAPAALEGNVGKGRKDALATIHAVRTIEITDRTSTLIKAANHLESLKNDPVLQVFKTFGQINDVVVRPHISFTTADEIPADICEVAESNHLNTVVIPWQHPKDAAAVLTYSQNHKVQTAIVRGVLAKFDKTVAVVVDRGQTSDRAQQEDTGVTTPLSPAIHNILVPFYGGPDDREALMFALNMRFQDNVRIVVLRVKLTSEVLQGSTSMEPENGVHPPVASNEIELTTRGTSSARPKSTLIDIDYHDDADERIMGQLHDLAACPTEKGCITIEMVTAEPGNPYVPVLDHLVAESSIRTVVFGFLGARWVNMVASHDTTLLNDQTARSVSFPHAIAHLLNMDGGDSSLKHSQSSQLDMARSNGATENGNTGNARSLAAMFRRPAHSHSRSSSDGRTSPATTSPRILPTAVAGAGVGDRTSPVMPAKASSRHSTSIIDTNRPQSLIVTSPRQDATMAANMAANQYTLPAGAQLPFDGLPATMEETMAATASGEFNPRSGQYIPRSSGHSHDRIAQRVLGDLGESLWNMPDIHVSLIAVRQFKH